ncbi:MAG: transposase [Planctomycetes bacterium]|nr:transposase [Planctomycetota bacterium]
MRSAPRSPRALGRHPLHVTLRLVRGLPSLRSRALHGRLQAALRAGAERHGLRVVHYGALGDHVHLVCEAADEHALARGMKGLAVRIARALNRLLDRTSAVFADRYHARELRAPRDVRNVLVYVLGNARRHGIVVETTLDPCSSAAQFDGWKELAPPREEARWLARASTWLLTIGWRRHGLVSIRELPRGAPTRKTGSELEAGAPWAPVRA